ncbi:GNAT family N-acetyltransferase [Enterobacter mori]|jgi:RimJ/RimL family protein N-acetyltransferase|uniref:GNAT family N-acetyltransferase n=1 Tax=Enterobacter mori TaxID=539813 RepID=UPI003D65D2F7
MPVLTTARLTCSPLHEQDWPFFLALQHDPDVMRFVAENRPLAEIRAAFDSRLVPWSPGSAHWLCLTVRDAASQAPLGVTGYIHREEDCAEVGFLFAPAAHGKGYGFESLRALCDYAFLQGGIRRLTATVTAGNIASKRVLEKTGFQLEGELRENYYLGGQWQNDWLFGLLKHEYLNNNP